MGAGDDIQKAIRDRDAHLPEDEVCPVHGGQWRHGRNMANAPIGRYCGWDGSIHPDEFMAYLEKPGTVLGPTDKNYKVYITLTADACGEDPAELRTVGSSDSEEPPYPDWVRLEGDALALWQAEGNHGDHRPKWVSISKRGPIRESKFYFEHLSVEQRKRFVEMLNDGRLTLSMPGRFYVLPFFISREQS